MSDSGTGFAISFGYYCATAAVLYTTFSLLRTRKKFLKFYAPKRYFNDDEVGAPPPRMPPSLFGWAPTILSFSQLQVLHYAGMDGLTIVRVLNFALHWSMIATFLCCAILLPIYLVNDFNDGSNVIDYFTVGNLPPHSNYLWAPAIMTWALTAITLIMLYKYHHAAVGLRINYLASRPKGAETHTVLVTDIPGIRDGTYVDRAAFILPKARREKLNRQLEATAAKATGTGTGVFGRIWYSLMNGLLSVTDSLHNSIHRKKGGDKLPITRYTVQGIAQTEEGVLPKADASLLDNGSVSGIPLVTKLSAWPVAKEQLDGGMTAQEMVESVFRNMFGDDFVSAYVVTDTSQVAGLVREYNARVERMADLSDGWAGRIRRGKFEKKGKVVKPMTTVLGPKYGKWGLDNYGPKAVKVPLVDFQIDRMEELKRVIQEKQALAANLPSSAAFVTLRTRVQQTLCASALIHHDTTAWIPSPAPSPEEVLWPNLRYRKWERALRRALIMSAYVALLFFFMIPVAAFQAWISAIANVSWLSFMYTIAPLNAVMTSVIPTLALKIFIAILPPLLKLMTRLQGVNSSTEVDLGLETKYYGFLYVTVFIGTILSGSLLNQVQDLIDNPSSFANTLGNSVPGTSVFFTNFVMLDALVAIPFVLVSVVGVILYTIKCKLAAGERAKAKLWKEQKVSYGEQAGDAMLILLLVFSFAPVFPIMAPFGILWAVSALICWKYKLSYVWRPECESGGKLWPKVYWQLLTSIWTMDLLMTCIIGVKEKLGAAIFTGVQLVIVPIAGYLINRSCQQPLQVISLMAATEMDMKEGARDGGKETLASAPNMFVNPNMKFDEAQHVATLTEARRWKEIFDTGKYDASEFEERADEDEDVANEGDAATHTPAAASIPTANATVGEDKNGSV